MCYLQLFPAPGVMQSRKFDYHVQEAVERELNHKPFAYRVKSHSNNC